MLLALSPDRLHLKKNTPQQRADAAETDGLVSQIGWIIYIYYIIYISLY